MGRTRKLMNLIMLVVFLSSNFLTSISYAFAEESGIIQGETKSEMQRLTNNTEERVEESKDLEDGEKTPGIEDIEPETTEKIEETEGGEPEKFNETYMDFLDEDTETQIKEECKTSLEGTEKGEISSEESMDKEREEKGKNDREEDSLPEIKEEKTELDIARETLNRKPIEKSEKYNKVTVKVLAPVNTFPENTQLVIETIKGNKLEEIKQQIADESANNINEDAEIVAFDIRFEYKLSDESIVELQPKENTVQVTFDYSKNVELKKADQNEEQEIEIYHINDKDEEGNKVEEGKEVVEKIEINEEKSERKDNALVIDAESFSVYTIVVQRAEETPGGESTQTWKYGEDYYTISIARPSSLDNNPDYANHPGFTIMDRNLGAVATGYADVASTGSYGYLYQWGNNYGFPYAAASNDIITNVGLTWDDSYNNSGYISKKYINGENFNLDVWRDGTHHYGIRGGDEDNGSSWWGAKLDNKTERQGPCPSGWHVPSEGEWGMLIQYWGIRTGASVNGGNGLFDLSDKHTDFMQYFNLPFAGRRDRYDASLNDFSNGYYWSSSPTDSTSKTVRRLTLGTSTVKTKDASGNFAFGCSIRCFKDSYGDSNTYTLTFDSQGGSEVVTGETEENTSRTRPADPIWSDHTFVDWFLSGSSTPFDFTGTPATEDLTVYAKWCGAGETYAFGLCLKHSDNVGSYTLTGNGGTTMNNFTYGTITIPVDGGEDIVIMDRNLGATDVWDINDNNWDDDESLSFCADFSSMCGLVPSTYGYHYQWGNNYGFSIGTDNNGDIDYNQVERTSNSYSNSTWVAEEPWYSDPSLDDDWYQGPCPEGWHVPSYLEWSDLEETLGSSDGLSFSNVLLLPPAGKRERDNILVSVGSEGFYSSSPLVEYEAEAFPEYRNIDKDWIYYNTAGFSDGLSVRCFKNITYDVTFDPNNGNEPTTLQVAKNGTLTADQIPTQGFGWFTSEDGGQTLSDEPFDFSNAITGNITLYARWRYCPEFYSICVEFSDTTETASIIGDDISNGQSCSCNGSQQCETKCSHSFTYGTITISREGEEDIVIMDRNLGATDVWTLYDHGDYSEQLYRAQISEQEYPEIPGGFGYYYQWGNSYGFSPKAIQSTDGNPVDVSTYGPSNPYISSTWIMANPWRDENSNWGDLWGGDRTEQERKGPCPTGWHVPNNEEMDQIAEIFDSDYDNIYFFSLPDAGKKDGDTLEVFSDGEYGLYWTSSSDTDNDTIHNLYSYYDGSYIEDEDIYDSYLDPSDGAPVRCFKNSTSVDPTFTITFMDGENEVTSGSVASGDVRSGDIPTPTKEGYAFGYWYLTGNEGTEFDFAGTAITGDLTLYAKWANCAEGETYYPELGQCATRDSNNIVYYWTDERGNGVISIKDPNGSTILTMLDKNQGASIAGLGSDSYGELYQRGNNAPIKTAPASTDQAEYKNYWPGHSFYDAAFRYGNFDGDSQGTSDADYWQNGQSYNNLRGGGNDHLNGGGGINNGSARQGPCAEGYHVPSIMEWNMVLQYFAANPNVNQTLTAQGSFQQLRDTNSLNIFKNTFKLPFAGRRDFNTSDRSSNGSIGYYWSSSSLSNKSYSPAFYIRSSEADSSFTNRHTQGYSVRCFKDSDDAPETYSIEFDANGGTLLGADNQGKLTQKVEEGEKAQQPVGISKDGATFGGWVDANDGETPFDFTATVSSNTPKSIQAKWISQHTVTLDATTNATNGGTASQASVTVNDGSTFSISSYTATPGDNTYIFVGWSEEPNSSVVLESDPTITSDKTLYAVYSKDVTATFNENGATSIGNNYLSCTIWNNVGSCSVVAPSITRDEWNVLGWSTSADSETASVNVGGDITLTADTPYYVITSRVYTANFTLLDSDAATPSSTTSSCTAYNQGACVISAPTLTANAGYTVDGWSATNGSTTADATTFIAGNTYYSVTHNNTAVTVTFDVNNNGGSNSSDSCYKYNGNSTCTVSCPDIIPANEFTKIGWGASQASHTANACEVNTDKEVSDNVTYYAQSQRVGKTVNLTYKKGSRVLSISTENKTCNVATVYNGDLQEGCSQPAPEVECSAGYTNLTWNKDLSTLVLNDTEYTATCLDAEKPVCSITTQPSKTLIGLYNQGTVTFTCTDNEGVTTDNLSADNITYDSDVVTLSNFTAGGTPTSKTFTFTYIAKAAGSTPFALNDGAVFDAEGNSNDVVPASNNVTVDTTAPTGTIQINGGTMYTNSENVTLTLNATDSMAGMGKMKFSCNGAAWSDFEDYTTTKSWNLNNGNGCTSGDGTKTVRVRYVDNAGNIAESSDTIILDTVAPSGSLSLNNGATYTNNARVSITMNASGGVSGMGKMRFSCDGNLWANWMNYGTNNTWTFSDAYTPITACTSAEGTKTLYVEYKDNAGNTAQFSDSIILDTINPTSQITTTDSLKSDSQTATLSCIDTEGVSKYYRGTKANPTDEEYTSVSSTTEYSTTKTVDEAGTYYLLCKDDAGNISNSASKAYYSYEVHNMLNAVDKAEGTYDATNYPQSSAATYLAPAGTTITFANVYSAPTYSSAAQYVGYTTSASGTPSDTASAQLNSDSAIYYFWFNRVKHGLTLQIDTGIENIYYKVNGAEDYTSTSSSTVVSMKAGSNASAYAVASNGYSYNATSFDEPRARNDVTELQAFYPVASVVNYNISYNLDGGSFSAEEKTGYTVEDQDYTLLAPSKQGYTFAGWKGSNGDVAQLVVTIEHGSTGNKLYTATWTENTNTAYTVKHMLQNVEGVGYTQTGEDVGMNGTTGAPTAATVNTYEGFTAQDITQGIIAADGSTVVEVKYDRITKTVDFKNEGASLEGYPVTLRYGAAIVVPSTEGLSKVGYHIETNDKWIEEVPATVGLENVVINVKWTENTDTHYTVKHWKQNVENDEYTEVVADREDKTGTTAQQTAAEAKPYVGFKVPTVSQETIAGNGNTVVNIYYDRDEYEVSYVYTNDPSISDAPLLPATVSYRYEAEVTVAALPELAGYKFSDEWTAAGITVNEGKFTMPAGDVEFAGTWTPIDYTITFNANGHGTAPTSITQAYRTAVTAPSDPEVAGYTFGGWYTESECEHEYTFTTMPLKGKILYAKWTENTDTHYTVKHWQQNVENDGYTEVEADREDKTGTTAQQTAAEAKPYVGFKVPTVSQETIAGNGNTVVNIYYDRDEYEVRYIYTNDPSISDAPLLPATASYRYEAEVTVAVLPELAGYTFSNAWTAAGITVNEGKFTMPAGDVQFTGTWTANEYTITFNENGHGTAPVAKTQAYRTAVTAPAAPSEAGWTFGGWYTESECENEYTFPSEMPLNGKTLYAKWTANTDTKYTVKHWQQNVENDEYTEVEGDREILEGTTAEQTTAVAKPYEGFKVPTINQATIAGNGSTVVEVKYDRIKYTVVWKNSDLSVLETDENAKFESIPSYDGVIPIKASDSSYNYTFKGWDPSISQPIMGDTEFIAIFNATPRRGPGRSGGGKPKLVIGTHGSAENDNNADNESDDKVINNKTKNQESEEQEQMDAYIWARDKGITTMPTRESAELDLYITREQLAKMMVVYVSKVLGKQPIKSDTPKYRDVKVRERGQEMYDYINLAYKYQIMGINADGTPIEDFSPAGEVSRAEFATVFSRVLFGDKYNQEGTNYYEKHIEALEDAGILTNTDYRITELRGWIMLMLYRTLNMKKSEK